MLQQTQVSTVIPYYKKWLKSFPTLRGFAKAPPSNVLKLWAGLGYYRRAKMFHRAARYVIKNLGGKIPSSIEELRKLPGIGRYTAGAIASIAFQKKVPVLDGNVIRILTRIFGMAQSIDLPATTEKLWKIAESLIPEKAPGDFNQSLMELGATICFPADPQCLQCPVKTRCVAHKKRKETFYPVRSRKENYEKILMTALVVRNKTGKVLIEKQPENNRWGGLWTFPFWESKNAMLLEAKTICHTPIPLLTLRHAFTKYRIRLEVFTGNSNREEIKPSSNQRWVSLAALRNLAFPSPHRKIADKLILENFLEGDLFPQKRAAKIEKL